MAKSKKHRIPLRFRLKCWLGDQIKKRVKCTDHYTRQNGPIHGSFGLSYCSYFTVPRLALQGMPVWWQILFLWLVNMLPSTPGYDCQRRDDRGRFIKDPWANYRRGSVAEILKQQELEEAQEKNKWKILAVEDGDNVKHTDQQ